MNDFHKSCLVNLLQEALEFTPDCFAIFSSDGTVVYCNTPFAKIYGLDKHEAEGKNNYDLLKNAWSKNKGVKIESDNFENWYKNLKKTYDSKNINHFETDLVDGRWFKMTRINLSNNYIMTYGTEITDIKSNQLCLENAAMKDPLTGLMNKRAFEKYFHEEIEISRAHKSSLSIMMIDIDHFKKINDSYGHAKGDKILVEFSDKINSTLRTTDSIYRVGGEEFVVLLPETNMELARIIAFRINKNIDNHVFLENDINLNVTVSIGISSIDGKVIPAQDLLEQADLALYKAKNSGRNAIFSYKN